MKNCSFIYKLYGIFIHKHFLLYMLLRYTLKNRINTGFSQKITSDFTSNNYILSEVMR